MDESAQLWELFINIEDLTLNSLLTSLAFQAEDKGVACPPISSGMTEVCPSAVPTLCTVVFSRFRASESFCSKCFFLWGHGEKIFLLLLRLGFVFKMKYFSTMHKLHMFVTAEYGYVLSIISHDKWYSVFYSFSFHTN